MIDNGIRFAPPKLAAQFSIESLDKLYGHESIQSLVFMENT